ncbi:hypothetical protein L6452_20415 [Arctium lappa]|uniref:Uncharacterized protein n=1 Tax=Arctium lappa TaxID=4217 RepID=A0ACB9BFP7_ARCLA|nr:hypothetical protein L6452_20415 [Arctium lappa]
MINLQLQCSWHFGRSSGSAQRHLEGHHAHREKLLRMISDISIYQDSPFPLEEYFPGPSLRFLDLLCNYVTCAYREKFEDECRAIFGNSSGLIFSIERLINKLSRQILKDCLLWTKIELGPW